MSANEILTELQQIKNKLDVIEDKVKSIHDNSDLYDPEGVLWRNRAMKYKRGLDNQQK